jgi:hypothetical protein
VNALKDSKVGAWALRPAGFGVIVIAWVDGKRDDLKIHTLRYVSLVGPSFRPRYG